MPLKQRHVQVVLVANRITAATVKKVLSNEVRQVDVVFMDVVKHVGHDGNLPQ